MPNWVTNTLFIDGPKDALIRLQAQVSAPTTQYYNEYELDEQGETISVQYPEVVESPISFHNIVSVPDKIQDEYWARYAKSADVEDLSATVLEGLATTVEGLANWQEKRMAERELSNWWYDWNVRNWGTKWDACRPTVEFLSVGKDATLTYRFDTAWAPVPLVVIALSIQNPDVIIDYEYEEEQGWGGKMSVKSGVILESEEWDIPDYDVAGIQ